VERNGAEALFRAPHHPYTKALLASVLTPEPGLGIPETGLGEAMPDPSNIPAGCRFHPRCPVALPRCAVEAPTVRGEGAAAAECHLL
jgi:peptide/nickel transport system ATP-binding protein